MAPLEVGERGRGRGAPGADRRREDRPAVRQVHRPRGYAGCGGVRNAGTFCLLFPPPRVECPQPPGRHQNMRLLTFALKRLGRLLLTVLLISTIIFFVIRVIPGDPALVIAGLDASPENVAAIRARIGTDQPLAVQYVRWLASVVRFDFGVSLSTGQPVTTDDPRAVPPDPHPRAAGHGDRAGARHTPGHRLGGPSLDGVGLPRHALLADRHGGARLLARHPAAARCSR